MKVIRNIRSLELLGLKGFSRDFRIVGIIRINSSCKILG